MEITRNGKKYELVRSDGGTWHGYKGELATAAFEQLATIAPDYMEDVAVTITYKGDYPELPVEFYLREITLKTYRVAYKRAEPQVTYVTARTPDEAKDHVLANDRKWVSFTYVEETM